MIWDAMSSAGVGPLCFLKTNVTAPVYQEILEKFMLPSFADACSEFELRQVNNLSSIFYVKFRFFTQSFLFL